MSIIKRITSAGLSLAMAATVIPSSFAVSTKSASTLSSVTAKYLDAENGKEIVQTADIQRHARGKVPADDHKLHLRGLYRKC